MHSLFVAFVLAQAPAAAPLDFTPEVKLLYRLVACSGDAPVPAELQTKTLEAYCKEFNRRKDLYRQTWVDKAQPFIGSLKPANLPPTVVYPFGGGDLISALTTYPEATEYTTMSLEHAGDPRRVRSLTAKTLTNSLAMLRYTSSGLLVANDSKTENLMKGQRGELPGQLSFFLMGMAIHGYEPVSLRYVKVNADGSLRALTQPDLDALEKEEAKLLHKAWVSPDFSTAFDNLELTFTKVGGGGPMKTHRHFAMNLSDDGFGKDMAMRAHLDAKGRIVAMTKAASYLLWRDNFSTIRDYLLGHMEFMVSDSTGVPPPLAKKAGFSQQAFGRFDESFLGANPAYNEAFRALWKDAKPLEFRYGYLDKKLQKHMLVTVKAAP
jgi:hypothetical protein